MKHSALFKTFLLAITVLLLPAAWAEEPPAESPAETQQASHQQVDINTADAPTLALALDGVGAEKAREIVAHRDRHGAFKSIDELTNVKGIGQATLERNRARLLISEK